MKLLDRLLIVLGTGLALGCGLLFATLAWLAWLEGFAFVAAGLLAGTLICVGQLGLLRSLAASFPRQPALRRL